MVFIGTLLMTLHIVHSLGLLAEERNCRNGRAGLQGGGSTKRRWCASIGHERVPIAAVDSILRHDQTCTQLVNACFDMQERSGRKQTRRRVVAASPHQSSRPPWCPRLHYRLLTLCPAAYGPCAPGPALARSVRVCQGAHCLSWRTCKRPSHSLRLSCSPVHTAQNELIMNAQCRRGHWSDSALGRSDWSRAVASPHY